MIDKKRREGRRRKMKKIIGGIIGGVIFVFALGVLIASCSKVEPGYVGIRVNMYGAQRGVEDFPLKTGRVWYNPFTEDVYKFPTFLQTVSWTRDINEGNPIDESITFNSEEGAAINADISLSYRVRAEKVPYLFVEFRQPIENITNNYMRSQVRDAFSRAASKMRAVDIFGSRKPELLNKVKADLNERLRERGFEFDTIAFIGDLRADPRVIASINAVIEATQRAIEAENKVRQTKAEAQQRIEEERGKAESRVIEAKAQAEANLLSARARAEANLIEAEAQARANDVVAKSLSPTLIRWHTVRRWDGKMPQVTGGGTPLVELDMPQ